MKLAHDKQKISIFCHCDLKLDPMILVLKPDLDTMKMYLHTKNEVSRSSGSKTIACTDRQTDRHTHTQTDRQTDRGNMRGTFAG